jgi:hypothetical protein
MYAELSGF